jgi:outer membrane protein OmpA-like peptidoglycan-associated protein
MILVPSLLRRWVPGLLPLAVLAGCASSDLEQAAKAQLTKAQTAYRQAQSDPNVQAYAQLQLADAQKAVQAAEQAQNLEDMQQLAYLAEKKSQTASVVGAMRKTEQDTQMMGRETQDILLQKRERELKAARADAEQARASAEARARDAEAKAREAEQARAQAEQARRAAEAEQAKTAALAKELADLKAQQTNRGLVLTVGDVLFATGRAEVAAGGMRSIDKLAEWLKKNPTRNLLIEGHTDNTGSEDLNMKLSQQRAEAVRDQLVSRGVGPDRITTKGYGPKYPVVANDSASGRQQNRRVEVVVLNEGATAESVAR